MYIRYEKAVHGKDRDREDLKRFLCSSPVYDPTTNDPLITRPATPNFEGVDDGREFTDLGLFPG